MYILCWWKHLLAISGILCSIGSSHLLLITIMFEFKTPSSRVYLSQAKTDAFHLPYKEGKFVYFMCLVLNPVLITKCNNLTMMGLQRLFDILKLVVDVKMWSHREDRVLFLVVLFNSRRLKSLSTLYVIAMLTSRSFPIPFCTSRILYCLMSRQRFLKYRKM